MFDIQIGITAIFLLTFYYLANILHQLNAIRSHLSNIAGLEQKAWDLQRSDSARAYHDDWVARNRSVASN
jgi:hypothetical protein